jgi:hypothetical protein
MTDETNWKSLRVKEETHIKIKTQAAFLGKSIDEYLSWIADRMTWVSDTDPEDAYLRFPDMIKINP